MKAGFTGLLSFLLFFLQSPIIHAENFLFKFPRQGGFKIKHHDRLDFTNSQHFAASGVLAIGLYQTLSKTSIKHPKLFAGLFATTVGLLKEWEDGYREGWGMKDVMFNELGIATFLLFSDAFHYTITLKQVVIGPFDYGAGIRFFRTADFTPLKASVGFYVIRDNHAENWAGVDLHMRIHQALEFHGGISMVNLGYANRFKFRPNVGLALRFF